MTAQTTEHLGPPRSVQNLLVPFIFQRRAKPSPEFRQVQLEQWLDAVEKHRPGELDDSARQAAALQPGTLADIIWGSRRV